MLGSQDRRSFLTGIGKAGGLALLARGLPAAAFPVEPTMQRMLDGGLRKEHPRLHLHAAQWAELRKAIPEDALLNGWYLSLQAVAAKMLGEAPVSYKLIGPRIPNDSLRANARRRYPRLRILETAAPANPTRASTAVGFSGELTQPPCACREAQRASGTANAKSARENEDFLIAEFLSIGSLDIAG